MTSCSFAWALAASLAFASGCAAETSDDSEPTTGAPTADTQGSGDYQGPRQAGPGACPIARTDIVLGLRADIPNACKRTIGLEDPGEMRNLRGRHVPGDQVALPAESTQAGKR